MSDLIGTGATAAGLLYAAKEAYTTLLRPSLARAGEVTADWSEVRLRRWLRVAGKVDELTPDEGVGLPAEERTVNAALRDATLFEDETMQSYASGMIAASRGEEPDDGSISYLTMIAGMSKAEIALHYALYRSLADSAEAGTMRGKKPRECAWHIPIADFTVVFPDTPAADIGRTLAVTLDLLRSRYLIDILWTVEDGLLRVGYSQVVLALFVRGHCRRLERGHLDGMLPLDAIDGPRLPNSDTYFLPV